MDRVPGARLVNPVGMTCLLRGVGEGCVSPEE